MSDVEAVIAADDADPVVQNAVLVGHIAALTQHHAELTARLEAVERVLNQVVEGHNTIGQMMQEAYGVITQVGQSFSKGGIGGLLGMMKGQKDG